MTELLKACTALAKSLTKLVNIIIKEYEEDET